VLRFAEFTLDPSTGELRRLDGEIVPLEPQPARVLAELASRPGVLVTRDALCGAVWPEGTHVAFDQGLNYCIRQVRAALGDNARQPVFIETVARRGYRFLPPVQVITPVRRRPAMRFLVVAAGFATLLWIAERLEEPLGAHSHHEAAVGVLRALHDLVF
jgi:DNA-binding winged helix-turn-helix (wHTH) protein